MGVDCPALVLLSLASFIYFSIFFWWMQQYFLHIILSGDVCCVRWLTHSFFSKMYACNEKVFFFSVHGFFNVIFFNEQWIPIFLLGYCLVLGLQALLGLAVQSNTFGIRVLVYFPVPYRICFLVLMWGLASVCQIVYQCALHGDTHLLLCCKTK